MAVRCTNLVALISQTNRTGVWDLWQNLWENCVRLRIDKDRNMGFFFKLVQHSFYTDTVINQGLFTLNKPQLVSLTQHRAVSIKLVTFTCMLKIYVVIAIWDLSYIHVPTDWIILSSNINLYGSLPAVFITKEIALNLPQHIHVNLTNWFKINLCWVWMSVVRLVINTT
jgi:hypothetical protein